MRCDMVVGCCRRVYRVYEVLQDMVTSCRWTGTWVRGSTTSASWEIRVCVLHRLKLSVLAEGVPSREHASDVTTSDERNGSPWWEAVVRTSSRG